MRRIALAALALVLLTPVASASVDADLLVTVIPHMGEIRPDREMWTMESWVNVSCWSQPIPPDGAVLRVQPVGVPPWAEVSASPSSFVFSAARCAEGGIVGHRGQVNVRVGQQAPAHRAASFTLDARLESPTVQGAGNDTVRIVPGYYARLGVNATTRNATIPPGGSASFPVVLTNLGNAETFVRYYAYGVGPLRVDAHDVLVPSYLEGAGLTAAESVVLIHAQPDATPGRYLVPVTITGVDAIGGARGDGATLTFAVTVDPAAVPGSALPGIAIAALVAALIVTRQRGNGHPRRLP
jgi:hypothetical protein